MTGDRKSIISRNFFSLLVEVFFKCNLQAQLHRKSLPLLRVCHIVVSMLQSYMRSCL